MSEERRASEHVLSDGSRVRIRPVERRDARTIQAGFRDLSAETRRRRFRRIKTRLSRREVDWLTDGEGGRRFAIGAVRLDADGWECEGLGVAHFSCLPDNDEIAEPNVTVLDVAHGKGLGRLLSEELVREASARGVKTFRTLLVDDHGWLRDRIARAYPDAQLTRRGQLLGADIPLPSLAPPSADDDPPEARDPRRDRYWSLLRWVAQGTVRPHRLGRVRAWFARLPARVRRTRPGPPSASL